MKLFSESPNKVRDAILVVFNVIIGYLVPVMAFFAEWSHIVPYWAEITIYVFAGIILFSNLILWYMIRSVFKMTSSVDENKLYGRK